MSEEIIKKGYQENGLKIGNYEYYSLGETTLNQLKKYKIVPKKDYKKYGSRKPDAILTDRRNKKLLKVIAIIEYKDEGKFKTYKDTMLAQEQCNDVAQILNAEIGICTDGSRYAWINPRHATDENKYVDNQGKERAYTIIEGKNEKPLIDEFIVTQKLDTTNIVKLNPKTKESLYLLESVRNHISPNNSSMNEIKEIVDPTLLAKQIWQDVWSVSGATPEKCLYTFVELFIFKYLSDLNILDEDKYGVNVNFQDLYALNPTKSFGYYHNNVREHLKDMFPEDNEDGTTIINGTVLSPEVPEHSAVFYKILEKFENFGELKNIDPAFKSKVFEQFMKESISKKNWGRYFTPRNIIDAIVEMSDIEKLPEGAKICDPACGVGGFILQPLKVKKNSLDFYYTVEGEKIISRYEFFGFDKGFEKEEQLTIILAKANMLIFLSELLKKNPTLVEEFSKIFNNTFKLLSKSILGTLQKTEPDKYDLIMTNPPYVTSGTSNYKTAIKNDRILSKYYQINGIGVESLFLEWIIKSLKPTRKALVIIPDGILNRLNDNRIREYIKNECIIDGIISLPAKSFYTTPKKTYILIITKKDGRNEIERQKQTQKVPVFTYLVSHIGETLDVKRFETPDENDLNEAVSLFNQFKGAKDTFKTSSLRCKIQHIEMFDPNVHWSVDRLWTKEEKIELGIEEEETILTLEEFKEKVSNTIEEMKKFEEEIGQLL